MKIGNQLKFGSAVLILLLGITISCTRSISVPVTPNIPSGNNNTPTATFANTATTTPTSSPTNTPTVTPSATPTNTNPGGFTSTFTFTATVTNTPTATLSFTSTYTYTYTYTVTPTSTPTTNPNLIADFEEGGNGLVTTNGLGLSGYVSGVSDPNSTAVTSLISGGTGCSSGSYFSVTGTTGVTSVTNPAVYGELQGNFLTGSPAPTYNIPAAYNAFVFCIQGHAPGNQVFFGVTDAATTASSDAAGQYIPISASWQSVTVCFDHMQSQGYTVTTVGHMFDQTTAVGFQWGTTTQSSTYTIQIDNFQFATVPVGNCPAFTSTPTPNPKIIDVFPANSNQIDVTNGRNGYWYCYSELGIRSGTIPAGGVALTAANAITVAAGKQRPVTPFRFNVAGL